MEIELSIVIPVYNIERYIEKCIQSVIEQDYDAYELLLIDDGSTDSSGEICDRYAASNSKIKVFHKENGGLSSARNYGLERAKGLYISFLDGDDYIDDMIFSKTMKRLKEDRSDIAVFSVVCVDEDGVETPYHSIVRDECIDSQTAFELMYTKSYFGEEAWNKVYKKDLFDGIQYPVGRKHEDTFTTYKLMERAIKISLVSGVNYYYLQRADSIMGQLRVSYTIDKIDSIDESLNFLRQKYPSIYKAAIYNLLSAGTKNLNLIVNENTDCSKVYLSRLTRLFRKHVGNIICNANISIKLKVVLLITALSPKLYVKLNRW